MKTLKFTVTMVVPREVSSADLKVYIHDACRSWGGQFHPDDPLFGLEAEQVDVRRSAGRLLAPMTDRQAVREAEARELLALADGTRTREEIAEKMGVSTNRVRHLTNRLRASGHPPRSIPPQTSGSRRRP